MINLPANLESPVDYLNIFFGQDLKSDILRYTNKYGQSKNNEFKSVTEEELDAYFGILILSGALQCNKLDIHELWETKYGFPIAKAAMSRERFKTIHINIRFDDIETRGQRRANDLFAPARDAHNYFMSKFRRHYQSDLLFARNASLRWVPFNYLTLFFQTNLEKIVL